MARDFDGSTDRIDYGSPANPTGSALTICAWVYPDVLSGSQYVCCAHDSGDTDFGILLFTENAEAVIMRNWSTGFYGRNRYGTGELTTGSWQHLLGTSDSSAQETGMELYVDGAVPGSTSTDTGSGSETSHSGSWSIGGRIYDDNRNFNGRIAEFGVWNRVLSSDEIGALAKGFAPSHFLNGLVFYVPLVGRNDTDRIAGKTPTYDGSSVVSHQRIYYPM